MSSSSHYTLVLNSHLRAGWRARYSLRAVKFRRRRPRRAMTKDVANETGRDGTDIANEDRRHRTPPPPRRLVGANVLVRHALRLMHRAPARPTSPVSASLCQTPDPGCRLRRINGELGGGRDRDVCSVTARSKGSSLVGSSSKLLN